MTSLASVLTQIDLQLPAAVQRLAEILRIPSVSAQPVHEPDCARAAQWFRSQLAELGFAATVAPSGGQPVVLAHHPGPAGANGPHVLFYGHYDVQPAEPLAEWRSPPFEPQIVDGPHGKRIVARGAVDDKGQVLMWLEALRAWHAAAGGPPVAVTVLIEGEEEVGSVHLAPFLQSHADQLRADIAVISDTNMWAIDRPAITTRLRGLVYAQIDLRAANRDLHSGLYGGSALNPLTLLCRILGDLHDTNGRVQIPDFYRGVDDIGDGQRAEWAGLGFDEAAFLNKIGLANPVGETGCGALERLWARPAADVNGIWGGYTGDGAKTVIPAEAHAKLSFRLVGQQDPTAILQGLRHFVAARLPEDATAEIREFGLASAVTLPADSHWIAAARAALTEEYGCPPVLMGSGGSIPVVETMHRLLGLDSLLLGFGLDDDQVHGPNEKFELTCFHRGMRSHARLLHAMANLSRG